MQTIANAFTCTGPYAVLIMLGVKRVENRSAMPAPASGRCVVTCSKSFCAAEYGAFVQWAARCLPPADFERVPAWADLKDWPGKVVGACSYEAKMRKEIEAEAQAEAENEAEGRRLAWDEGYPFWWKLSDVVCFDRPIPCRGNVGMWQMPPALAAQVSVADALASCEGEAIASVDDAARLFRLAMPLVGGNEGVFVLPLDSERRVLAEPILVSLGVASTAVVLPNEVFAAALKAGATSLILAHNHPSGNPTPSAQDRELTDELAALGGRLGVKVLDHLIIGGVGGRGECVSMKISGDMK